MAVRVAINGFGRTGRAAFRAAHEHAADVEWVAINDVAEPEMLAHLLRNDTVYGRFAGEVEVVDGRYLGRRRAHRHAVRGGSGEASVGRARCGRRDRVDGSLSHT